MCYIIIIMTNYKSYTINKMGKYAFVCAQNLLDLTFPIVIKWF